MKTCIEGRKCEKTQEEDPCFTHSKPTEKSKTCQHVDFGLLTLRTKENKFLLFKSPNL